jgi:hypothetical protein
MGKDGKRLKEVALDGKILSDGIKGDPNKFNSKSSDRSTRMDNPIFGRGGGSIKGNNSLASVVVGGFAIGQAVQTQAVAVLVGFPGGSRQPNGSGSATMSTAPQPNMPQMPTQGPILLTPQQMDTISSQLTPPDRFSQVQLKQEFQKAPANLSQVSGNNTQKVDIGVTLGQTIKSSNQVAPAIAQQINSNVGQSSTANTNPLAGAILVGNVASGTGAPTNMPKAISIISNQKISTAKPAPVVKPVETVVSTGYRASSSSTPQAETFLQAFERQWRQESENPTYSYQKESPAEKLQRERKQRAKERLRDLGI